MWIKAQNGDWLNLAQQKGVGAGGTNVYAGDSYNGGVIISEHSTDEEAVARRDVIMAQMQKGEKFFDAD